MKFVLTIEIPPQAHGFTRTEHIRQYLSRVTDLIQAIPDRGELSSGGITIAQWKVE